MKVLLTFDTGYAPHAATVLESIIQNCPQKLDFVVIYYNLDSEVQRILGTHFKSKVNSLTFYKVDETILKENIKITTSAQHLQGLNTYLRLFAPAILTEDDHVIYLDCDTIVQENILEILKDADLSKPVCAAVEYDPAYKFRNLSDLNSILKPVVDPFSYEIYWFRTYKALNLNPEARYFNAGILIINLAYWRQYDISKKAISFLTEHAEKAFSADQDALNSVINGDFCVLHPKWNTAVLSTGIMSNYEYNSLAEATDKAAIIHIAGGVKPWHYLCMSPYRKLYWKYRKATPWPKVKFTDKLTPRKFLRKLFYIIFNVKIVDMAISLVYKYIFRKRQISFCDATRGC